MLTHLFFVHLSSIVCIYQSYSFHCNIVTNNNLLGNDSGLWLLHSANVFLGYILYIQSKVLTPWATSFSMHFLSSLLLLSYGENTLFFLANSLTISCFLSLLSSFNILFRFSPNTFESNSSFWEFQDVFKVILHLSTCQVHQILLC